MLLDTKNPTIFIPNIIPDHGRARRLFSWNADRNKALSATRENSGVAAGKWGLVEPRPLAWTELGRPSGPHFGNSSALRLWRPQEIWDLLRSKGEGYVSALLFPSGSWLLAPDS